MREKKTLTLEEARIAGEAVIRECQSIGGNPVAVAVVGEAGDLIYFARMDGVGYHVEQLAINKAYTAAIFGRDTAEVQAHFRERQRQIVAYGNPARHTDLEGGVVLKMADGIVVGGIGVGGRKKAAVADKGIVDPELAKVGAKALGL
ncbi:heme-binding protein [Chloroflexota bacterium]